MKKFICAVLALVMVLSLAACGSKQDDNGDVTVSDGKTRRVFQKSAIAQVRLHLTI